MWVDTGAVPLETLIDYPECNIRIDNFVFDVGMKGTSLMDQLVGEKRIYYQDSPDGSLYVYRSHFPMNTTSNPYSLSIANGDMEVDANIITRLRVEGAEVLENFDEEMMREYGNLYHMLNMNEINNLADAKEFNAVLLEDNGSRVITKQFMGAADPRIEPNDLVYVKLDTGDPMPVIVDQADFSLSIDEQTAIFDISIQGRVPRSALL
jgi:hypothetical protein